MTSSVEQILLHFMFAFIVPGAWALLLYPYFRFYRVEWTRMIVIVVSLSLVAMVAKEKLDRFFSLDAAIADILGVFLGSAFLSAIFIIGGKKFSRQTYFLDEVYSLQDFLVMAKELEYHSAVFYFNMATELPDFNAKELCYRIGFEEKAHAAVVAAMLERWLPKRPGYAVIRRANKELARMGLYPYFFSHGMNPKEVVQYALDQERKNIDFYQSFTGRFSSELKRSCIQQVAEGEREHARKLEELLLKM